MENRTINMNEEWVKWNPTEVPNGKYIVTKFIQDAEGVKLILDDEINLVEIFFDGVPVMMRSSDEGVRMRTWGEVQIKYQDKFFFRDWFLYIVNNSKLTSWVLEESCGFYDNSEIIHYCIVTQDDVIDILATFEPQIRVSPM